MTEPRPTEPESAPDAPAEIGYCWKCAYDLRGLGDQQCPECGFRFDIEAVRDMNLQWCAARLQGLQAASFLQALACCVLFLSMMTRGLSATGAIFLTVAGSVAAVMMGMRAMAAYWSDGLTGAGDIYWHVTRRISRLLWMGVLVVILVFVFGGHLFIFQLALLAAGLLLAGVELQSYRDGKRRHKTYGISASAAESLNFSYNVTRALLAVSIVGLLLLVAYGR